MARYRIPVFVSYPRPSTLEQQGFIDLLSAYLYSRGIAARTLGVTDYDTDAPLHAIRRLMRESNGLITVAFRRMYVEHGAEHHMATIPGVEPRTMADTWLTSPWSHIEPAMA